MASFTQTLKIIPRLTPYLKRDFPFSKGLISIFKVNPIKACNPGMAGNPSRELFYDFENAGFQMLAFPGSIDSRDDEKSYIFAPQQKARDKCSWAGGGCLLTATCLGRWSVPDAPDAQRAFDTPHWVEYKRPPHNHGAKAPY